MPSSSVGRTPNLMLPGPMLPMPSIMHSTPWRMPPRILSPVEPPQQQQLPETSESAPIPPTKTAGRNGPSRRRANGRRRSPGGWPASPPRSGTLATIASWTTTPPTAARPRSPSPTSPTTTCAGGSSTSGRSSTRALPRPKSRARWCRPTSNPRSTSSRPSASTYAIPTAASSTRRGGTRCTTSCARTRRRTATAWSPPRRPQNTASWLPGSTISRRNIASSRRGTVPTRWAVPS
mmetsp:Transcript_15459/g.36956  ORF Transcript_15459/g.36956 Transcript_15459/m.36956 type:complete len:235 (-) Transcript_15459:682-1386(-)